MSLIGKKGPKDSFSNEEIHMRKRYSDPSTHFSNWVNQLGLEKSWLGRVAYYLDRRWRIRRVLLVFLYSIFLSFLMVYEFDHIGSYSIGDIAPIDIKSPISLKVFDEMATEAKRVEAENELPLILDYEYEAYDEIIERLYKSFSVMRSHIRDVKWPKSEEKRDDVTKSFMRHKTQFTELLGVEIPDYLFEWLISVQFNKTVFQVVRSTISSWQRSKIVDLPDFYSRASDTTVLIRQIDPNVKNSPESNRKLSELMNMRDRSLFKLAQLSDLKRLRTKDIDNLETFTQYLLVPNLTLNKHEYSERQKKARESVLPVQLSINKNQVIVAKGSPIQPIHLTIFGYIDRVRSLQRTDFMSLFSGLLLTIFVSVMYFFIRSFSRYKTLIDSKDMMVMGIITIVLVLVSRGWMFLTETALLDRFGDAIPQIAFIFAAPLVAGSMLIGLLIVSYEVVWGYAIFQAAVMGVMAEMNVQVFIVTMVAGIVASQGVINCKKRNDIHWAGLKAGMASALTAAVTFLLMSVGEQNVSMSLLWVSSAAMIGGVMSSFIAMIALPTLEASFNYTTDIKLLELASLNHPIMQEMMMKAPGTYHHCMNVGNMADSAAKEIGANPLLAKVMAIYHDIGKMEHAQYFIENQRRGHNPHDHISPHMSKTILIAHVKDGAEIAIRNKLGKPIVDGILQHHGTTLISYFYNKALEGQDDDTTGAVEESDFRYPGPKPQFKEAALVMLADSIEATARSLEEPTPGRLNSIVENIIESKFMDGQLDECNLSISDLALIKICFKRVLLSMYHQRMDYPHMKDGKAIEQPQVTSRINLKRQ